MSNPFLRVAFQLTQSRSKHQKYALQRLQAISDVIVGGVVVTAVELLIRWNGIQNVDSVSTAGQTIPMIVGIGLVVRVLYIGLSGDVDDGDDWSSTSYGSYYSGSKSARTRSDDGASEGGRPPAAWPGQPPPMQGGYPPPRAPFPGQGPGGYPPPPPVSLILPLIPQLLRGRIRFSISEDVFERSDSEVPIKSISEAHTNFHIASWCKRASWATTTTSSSPSWWILAKSESQISRNSFTETHSILSSLDYFSPQTLTFCFRIQRADFQTIKETNHD